jgi:hypothetical protein
LSHRKILLSSFRAQHNGLVPFAQRVFFGLPWQSQLTVQIVPSLRFVQAVKYNGSGYRFLLIQARNTFDHPAHRRVVKLQMTGNFHLTITVLIDCLDNQPISLRCLLGPALE